MSGFNPLAGLEKWHWKVAGILIAIGLISVVVGIVTAIVWAVNNI